MTRRAFTLIELIIATVILSLIVVSIYSAFSAGIKAWRRGSEGEEAQKVRIALLKIQKELRGSFFFSDAPFEGTSSEVAFPLIISEGDRDRVYIVRYYITEDRGTGAKALMKSKMPFRRNNEIEGKNVEEFIFSADSIVFNYGYGLKDGSKGLEWLGLWGESQKMFPSAVKISFRFSAGGEIYNKTIFIPQGRLGKI